MRMMIEALFWLSAACVVYVYAGYPLLLVALRRVLGVRRVAQAPADAPVTLIVSAFNEEAVIAEKLRNCAELDYPRDRLQVLVVSDASDDRTDAIVASFASQGVELLRMTERGGKTLGLNAAMQRARGEYIVFSDANALYAPDALAKLLRNFADPAVGAVIGESLYADIKGQAEQSEGLYWKYETGIKRLESQIGSVVGGDGAIYAIRKALFVPMRADALSDFVNPLQIVRSGYRCIYEPEARSYERAAGDFSKEFRRKVRIVNRAWRALQTLRGLLNPFRYGLFAVELISHKLLRWLVPLFLVVLFALSIMLAGRNLIYTAALALQILFYALALAGHGLRRHSGFPRLFAVPFYFCLVNVASALGIIEAYRGKTYTTWTTARAPGQ